MLIHVLIEIFLLLKSFSTQITTSFNCGLIRIIIVWMYIFPDVAIRLQNLRLKKVVFSHFAKNNQKLKKWEHDLRRLTEMRKFVIIESLFIIILLTTYITFVINLSRIVSSWKKFYLSCSRMIELFKILIRSILLSIWKLNHLRKWIF